MRLGRTIVKEHGNSNLIPMDQPMAGQEPRLHCSVRREKSNTLTVHNSCSQEVVGHIACRVLLSPSVIFLHCCCWVIPACADTLHCELWHTRAWLRPRRDC